MFYAIVLIENHKISSFNIICSLDIHLLIKKKVSAVCKMTHIWFL